MCAGNVCEIQVNGEDLGDGGCLLSQCIKSIKDKHQAYCLHLKSNNTYLLHTCVGEARVNFKMWSWKEAYQEYQ